ncbi:hypothetical protein TURU_090802 [Turdus rufiventris]|nr:hypothetical protein TURU_090802 [Turdus rufiventris]
MALALRLFLLLLLAVALPARAAQAAPWRAEGAGWDRIMDYVELPVNDGLNMPEHDGGPPRWKNQDVEDKKSLEASKLLDKMLSDLQRRRGERARKASPAARLQEDFQPLEPPAGAMHNLRSTEIFGSTSTSGGAIVWRREALASPNNLAFLLILIHVFDKLCLLKMEPP